MVRKLHHLSEKLHGVGVGAELTDSIQEKNPWTMSGF